MNVGNMNEVQCLRVIAEKSMLASTLSGFSQNGLANGAAVLAATPDFDGQWITAIDGYVGLSTGTGAGNVQGVLVVATGVIYCMADLVLNNFNVTAQRFLGTTAGAAGSHQLLATGSTYVDNVLDIQNTTTAGVAQGYSAIAFWHHDDTINNGRALAVGVGPNVAGNSYQNRAYIATNPPTSSATNAPMDIIITQERNDGAGHAEHYRMLFNGTAKTITAYGWTLGVDIGPVAWYIAEDGRFGVGTATLTANAQATFSGPIVSAQQRWRVSKGNVDQTIVASTWTVVTWSTEAEDVGGVFASNVATPTVAGHVQLHAVIYFSTTTAGERLLGAITKNGTRVCELELSGNASTQISLVIPWADTTNGSDVFGVQVFRSVGTTVGGGNLNTFFQGYAC